MPKKEFTSFDVAATVQELKTEIPDSRVNNIYQLDAKTFVLKLHKPDKPPIRIVLEAGRRLHLTAYALENPRTPPAFCMAVRKHLRSAWLLSVEQYEFERIVAFSFKTHEGTLKLVLELFGEGNVILVSEKGEILQALLYKRMRDRNILRNEIFQHPPSSSKNPFIISQNELFDALKNASDVEVVRALARFLGIGGAYAEEILLRASVEKAKPCSALADSESKAIFEALQSLLSPVLNGKFEPCIVLNEEGNFADVVPFKLKRYTSFTVKPYSTFNSALDEFYIKTTAFEKATAEIETGELKREEEKLKRVIAEQQRTAREAEEKTRNEMQIGNAIYAHSSELQTLLDVFSRLKSEGKNWSTGISEVIVAKRSGKVPFTFYDSLDPKNGAVNVSVDNLQFSLSLRKTLFENAAEYYTRGKKAKQKSAGALAALGESQKRLAQVKASISEAEQLKTVKPAEAMQEISKRRVESKEWYQKFRWFTSTEGFLVVAGKDAVSNEVLIKKHTNPEDLVFHADIIGSPFVVVKTSGKTPKEQTLREAAEFAAAFSRAWRESMGSADVFWVKPEQLNKSGPSGEFVPHGAFAVSGKRNWMRGVPLRVALGVVVDEEVVFVGGPVDSVTAKTKAFVVLGPGDFAGRELLKQVLRVLALRLPREQREEVGKASIESIREFVPYTKGRIVEAA